MAASAENDIEIRNRVQNGNENVEAAVAAAPAHANLATNANGETNVNGEEMVAKGKMDSDSGATLTNFKVLYLVTQLCGITLIILIASWIGIHLGGLGGTSTPKLEFNWHPLLMTIGLIFLYGNSILIYRGFRMTRKRTLKYMHAGIHLGALILSLFGLKASFDSHNLATPPIPNLYSLHSWLGLITILVFLLQYVAGFVTYLSPELKTHHKILIMPYHIYFGLFGFILSIATCLLGLTEKIFFSMEIAAYANRASAGVMANMIGILCVAFGGLVMYLVTQSDFKRKPLPEDTILLSGRSNLEHD